VINGPKNISRKNVRLPYHIRVNIKEPRETDYVDLKRRKHERFEDYQIRVHFDYLDRRIRHQRLDAPNESEEQILDAIDFSRSRDKTPTVGWVKQAALRAHKPGFDITQELRDTVENTVDDSKTPPLWQEDGEKAETVAPVVEEEPEEGEISD